jgi:hypothetical protein
MRAVVVAVEVNRRAQVEQEVQVVVEQVLLFLQAMVQMEQTELLIPVEAVVVAGITLLLVLEVVPVDLV